jgi:xanthine dehydrogenase YagR molybdenum-binding subunit
MSLRASNYAEVEPITGKPYSSKALRECYAKGATEFGWSGRPRASRQMRDHDGFLVGWGMGTAVFHCPMFAAEARAVLHSDGVATIETSVIDMGQGALTALAQIAADSLELDINQVALRFGGSLLPDGGVAGGSGHTATAGSAIDAAGRNVVARLADLATADRDSPLFGAGRSSRAPGDSAAETTRAAARAMPKSSPALDWRRSMDGTRACAIRRPSKTTRCRRTEQSSRRSRSTRISARFAQHAWSAPLLQDGSSTRG